MSINEKLQKIQGELEVPKNQYNKFGNYYYRNCEDIFAAAKPVCEKHGCLLTVTDEIEERGGRLYIKASACITDIKGESMIVINGFAREEENKKGMDAAQITGSASSYARKYALNGLFCLDDVKDPDTGKHNGAGTEQAPNKPEPVNTGNTNGKKVSEMLAQIKDRGEQVGMNKAQATKFAYDEVGILDMKKATLEQLGKLDAALIDKLEGK